MKFDWKQIKATSPELELSVRAVRQLDNYNPNLTLGDIANMRDEEFLRIPKVGRKTLKEMRDLINSFDGTLKIEQEDASFVEWCMNNRAVLQSVRAGKSTIVARLI